MDVSLLCGCEILQNSFRLYHDLGQPACFFEFD